MTVILDHYAKDFYGTMKVSKSMQLLVIHYAVIHPPTDGKGLHTYMHTNPFRYRWHRSFGSNGETYRCAKWDYIGAHDSGLNSKAAGMEHVGDNSTDFSKYPKMLGASAAEAALWCKFVGTKPSRSRIIGHNEDAKYGGTSTHVDPCGTGPKCIWPWDDYMDLVNAAYNGGEDDEMGSANDYFDSVKDKGVTAGDFAGNENFLLGLRIKARELGPGDSAYDNHKDNEDFMAGYNWKA